MSDNAEYNDLVDQKTKAQNQYNSCSSRIEDLEYNLGRLKTKYEWVETLKESYKAHQKTTKEIHDEDHKWKGSTYDSYSTKMDTVELEDESYYKNSLDHVHDAINTKMTEIENKLLEERYLLGKLWGKINTLANKIENFFN